jgi:hypothetical protein
MPVSYNYEHFDAYVAEGGEAAEFAAFPNHRHVGEQAPDAVLTALDGGQERLSDRWRTRTVVMEFGSFT